WYGTTQEDGTVSVVEVEGVKVAEGAVTKVEVAEGTVTEVEVEEDEVAVLAVLAVKEVKGTVKEVEVELFLGCAS
ncbi:unnamed protein product, partial [Closterium sp. NIES-54]